MRELIDIKGYRVRAESVSGGGDPMRRLQEIVGTLDFIAIAVQVKADLSY